MSHAPSPANPESRKPLHRHPLVLVVIAVCLGIVVDYKLQIDWRLFAGATPLFVATWFALYRKDKFQSAIIPLLLSWASLAGLWHHVHWNWYPPSTVTQFTSNESSLVCIRMKLVSEPRLVSARAHDSLNPIPSGKRTRALAYVQAIRDGENWIEASGWADLVVHAEQVNLGSGEVVQVFGRLVGSDSTRNPGQFNFRNLARSRRKLATVHAYYVDSIQKLESPHVPLLQLRSKLRKRLNELTWKYIDKQRAPFAAAILLGNREQLSNERREQFLTTGTIHLLAISGLHIGILAGLFFLFYRVGVIGRSPALLCTIVFVLFYAWLVEFRPPVLRASILIVLFSIARLLGKSGLSYNLLALAGLIVLAFNPSDLFQIGPQFSFLAVLTIIFCRRWIYPEPEQDPLKRLIANTRGMPVRIVRWLSRNAWTTVKVSALIWSAAVPLVAYHFHLVVPVSLLLNPLVMVPIAIGLYAGLGVLVFGWFWPGAATVCGRICEGSLALIESMIESGQGFPSGHFWASGPETWAVMLFYIGMFLFAIYPLTRINLKWLFTIVVAWLAFAWILPNWNAATNRKGSGSLDSNSELVCTFVDTGHGCSVLVQLPDKRTVIYDAGCLGSARYGMVNISDVLWDENVNHIDALIISHADVDHFNSAVELCQRFSVGVIYLSPMMLESESDAVSLLLQEVEKAGIEVRKIYGGKRLKLETSEVEVFAIAPEPNGNGGNDNSNSVVLLIEAYSHRVLLPGDLEDEGLRLLLESPSVDCDLVMAPHHGSLNSHPGKFARWAQPEEVVISSSIRRVKQEAVKAFQDAGSRVWLTGRDGAIRCIMSPEGMRVSKWIHGDRNDSGHFSNRGFRWDKE